MDDLRDTANRREANFGNLVGASHRLPGIEAANATVTFFSEVGSDRAIPPIYTFDLGMNFQVDRHTILDVGINLGLNSAAPKVQIYTGISASILRAAQQSSHCRVLIGAKACRLTNHCRTSRSAAAARLGWSAGP